MTRIDNKILWLLLIVALIIVLWWAIDHVLFPDLPMPAGAPPIVK